MKTLIKWFWVLVVILTLALIGNCLGLVTDSFEIGKEIFH